MSSTSLQPLGDGQALVVFESNRHLDVEITGAIIGGVDVPMCDFSWQVVSQWERAIKDELARERDDFLADQQELAL